VYTLAGADELFGIGLLNGAQTLSLEKLFLDAEMVRAMRAIVAGAATIGEANRVRHREPGGVPWEWHREETPEYDWAAQRVRQILASHQPDPLPDGLPDELCRIAAAYPI
jgi:hypothetical protein